MVKSMGNFGSFGGRGDRIFGGEHVEANGNEIQRKIHVKENSKRRKKEEKEEDLVMESIKEGDQFIDEKGKICTVVKKDTTFKDFVVVDDSGKKERFGTNASLFNNPVEK